VGGVDVGVCPGRFQEQASKDSKSKSKSKSKQASKDSKSKMPCCPAVLSNVVYAEHHLQGASHLWPIKLHLCTSNPPGYAPARGTLTLTAARG